VESLNRSLRKIIKTRSRIPQRRSRIEVAVSRATAGLKEVDDADLSLAGSAQPLYNSVSGTGCRPWKELRNDEAESFYIAGPGKEELPPSPDPIPKDKTRSFGCVKLSV
jgi:hypothetical protein